MPKISTHTLTWSVTNENNIKHNEYIFQLTRSRGAWHQRNYIYTGVYIISTHTLTWSVTHKVCPCCFHRTISTHTLTWSVTVCHILLDIWYSISTHTLTWSVTSSEKFIVQYCWFQLTRSRGAWPLVIREVYDTIHFNSHAHVERDSFWDLSSDQNQISTHTLTWSVTNYKYLDDISQQFQLTRSRGAWRNSHYYISVVHNFKSHAHVERDNWWKYCSQRV